MEEQKPAQAIENSEAAATDELPAEVAETDGLAEAEKNEDQTHQKLFTLHFHIPFEEYYQFHLIMGRENVKKNSRKTALLGWVELVFGLVFLFSLATSQTQGGPFYYFLIAVMICMGLYGVLFYRFFYPKSLRRAVKRQYEKTLYLQSELVIDFYANRLVEHVKTKEIETFWHSILEVRESTEIYMLMLDKTRCLLIPKSQLEEQTTAFEQLLQEVCTNYEKPRYEV